MNKLVAPSRANRNFDALGMPRLDDVFLTDIIHQMLLDLTAQAISVMEGIPTSSLVRKS
jgi:hypothetical protein